MLARMFMHAQANFYCLIKKFIRKKKKAYRSTASKYWQNTEDVVIGDG